MKEGFTLVELLVVVVIIGILAYIAMPHYEKAVWNARTSQLYTSAKALSEAQELYYTANGRYANRFSSFSLQFDGLKKSATSFTGRAVRTMPCAIMIFLNYPSIIKKILSLFPRLFF